MELHDWEAFCDRLREAGRAIVRPECPQSADDRAEGYRYLLGFLQANLTSFLYDSGPEQPSFVRSMDDVVKFGLDAPDGINSYGASVRDDLTYRIWGNAGTVRYVGWQLMATGQGSLANLALHDFAVADDGTFELWLSPEPHEGNWVATPPGVDRILMRQFQYDWRERYAEVHIEAVGAPDQLPQCLDQRPDPDDLAQRVETFGQSFVHMANFWVDFVHDFRKDGDNVAPPAIFNPAIGGSLQQLASNGYWVLGDDEALLLEFTPPSGWYWSVCLGNFWFESIELSHHQTSLNGAQVHVDDDGRCRIVIAHDDPGIANWLATVGHDQGTMTFRWLLCDGGPDIDARVVPFADLAAALPPGTARVTAEERAATIDVRRESVARRFGLPMTTRWSYTPTAAPESTR